MLGRLRRGAAPRRRTLGRRCSGAVGACALLAVVLAVAGCALPRIAGPSSQEQHGTTEAEAAAAENEWALEAGSALEQGAVATEPLGPTAQGTATEQTLAALEPGPEVAIAPLVEGQRPIKVGLLVPLSGRFAREGAALLDAAQLALFDVANRRFILLPRDTGGTPSGAAEAALGLLDEGAELILGPLFSAEVAAAAPIARARGVNIVAFSTDPTVAGDGVYLLGHRSRQLVDRLVRFARARGLRRFAVLAPDDAYGQIVVRQFRQSVAAAQLELSRVAFFAADGSDTEFVVRQLADYDERREALEAERLALASRDDEISQRALRRLETLDTLGDVPYDALFVPDGGDRLRQVVPLLPYYDIDPTNVRLMGTGLWDDPKTLSEPTLVGGWFVGPPREARDRFEARFREAYGRAPHRLAALAYDATALAAALARSPAGADFSALALGDRRGFLGADGIFRFDEVGLPERGLAVLQVRKGGSVAVVSPPRSRFATAVETEEP